MLLCKIRCFFLFLRKTWFKMFDSIFNYTGIDRVVKATILLSNMDDYKAVNEEYAKGK